MKPANTMGSALTQYIIDVDKPSLRGKEKTLGGELNVLLQGVSWMAL